MTGKNVCYSVTTERLSNITKQIRLHIDKAIKPTALRYRRVPFQLRPVVEKELDHLEQMGVIEKVTGPTPWVSPLVVAPKPKQLEDIRLCVDMRLPNRAIHRERHITPTIDEIITDLNGARWFSKIDLNSGYHQLELDEASRYITTFFYTCRAPPLPPTQLWHLISCGSLPRSY